MSGAYIRTRKHKHGTSYVVHYRIDGSGRILYAGTFKTKREAKIRRDVVAGELAACRHPRVLLDALTAEPPPIRTFSTWVDLYLKSRIDLAPKTLRDQSLHLRRAADKLGSRDVLTITSADVQALVAEWTDELGPASVAHYVSTVRQLFDFAKVDPNPSRDKTVKLPRVQQTEVQPPSADEFLTILDHLPPRLRLAAVLIEQTGMRVGEAIGLQWGDVDVAGCQFRLRSQTVKTSRPRWPQVPAWLMEIVDGLCPVEDRTPTRKVLGGLSTDRMRAGMLRACRDAGIPGHSPHSLRHRRASLWHGQGVPAAELARRLGHSRPSMSLDIYSHVMPLGEADARSLEEALR